MQNLILIDKNNNQVGTMEKLQSHLGKGTLHRAFTTIIINDKNEILLTQRSAAKPLWPNFWDLSFSSHPSDGQTLEKSIIKRAKEELGVTISQLKLLFNYYYQIKWNHLYSEHEINHIFLSKFNNNLKPNLQEISNYKWLSYDKMLNFIYKNKKSIAPWVIIALKKIKKKDLTI